MACVYMCTADLCTLLCACCIYTIAPIFQTATAKLHDTRNNNNFFRVSCLLANQPKQTCKMQYSSFYNINEWGQQKVHLKWMATVLVVYECMKCCGPKLSSREMVLANISAPTSSSTDKMLMFFTQLFAYWLLLLLFLPLMCCAVCYSVADVVSSVNMIYIKSQLIYE